MLPLSMISDQFENKLIERKRVYKFISETDLSFQCEVFLSPNEIASVFGNYFTPLLVIKCTTSLNFESIL